jgi:hypothetical protein
LTALIFLGRFFIKPSLKSKTGQDLPGFTKSQNEQDEIKLKMAYQQFELSLTTESLPIKSGK